MATAQPRNIRSKLARVYIIVWLLALIPPAMQTDVPSITPVHTNLPADLPGLSPMHESIMREGKSVFVMPGDEVVLHPKRGFLVLNRHFTPWEKVDTPDPFFNLPVDGYNSGRYVVGLAMERERERLFQEFTAKGLAPPRKVGITSSTKTLSQPDLHTPQDTSYRSTNTESNSRSRPRHGHFSEIARKSIGKARSRRRKQRTADSSKSAVDS